MDTNKHEPPGPPSGARLRNQIEEEDENEIRVYSVARQSRRDRSAAFTPLHLRYAQGTPENQYHHGNGAVKRRKRRAPITAMIEAIPCSCPGYGNC